MNKICDIVIPIFNSPDWLNLCVMATELSDINGYINRVILVDDCSQNETILLINKLAKKYSNIEVIRNDSNQGFVKTCNRGMAISQMPYILLLNSDCLLAENTIEKLVTCMEQNKKIGLSCPISNNAANISIVIPQGLNYVEFDKVLERKFKGEYFQACTIVGNCLMISKECYTNVGSLDEIFGMGYGEETDYQFRAQKQGFDSVVLVDTYVFHKSQMSFGNGEILNEQKKRNRKIFMERWGKEYEDLLKYYSKNDPVEYVLKNLSKNDYLDKNLLEYKNLTKNFVNQVERIDKHHSLKRKRSFPSLIKNQYIDRANIIYRDKGAKVLFKRTFSYVLRKLHLLENSEEIVHNIQKSTDEKIANFKDIIFITNVTDKENLYRCKVLKEEIEFNNLYTDILDVMKINNSFIKDYRCFVFVDVKISDKVQEFAVSVANHNKSVIFCTNDIVDIDINLFNNVLTFIKETEKYYHDRGYNVFRHSIAFKESTFEKCSSLNRFDRKFNNKIKIGCFGKEINEIIMNQLNCLNKNIYEISIFGETEYLLSEAKYFKLNDYYNITKLRENAMFFILESKSDFKANWCYNAINKVINIILCDIVDEKLTDIEKYSLLITTDNIALQINDFTGNNMYVNLINDTYQYVLTEYSSINNGFNLSKWIQDCFKKNIAFVLPAINVCGGVNVVAKHCLILKKYGWDAFIINTGIDENDYIFDNEPIEVVSSSLTAMRGKLDKVVATMWITNLFIDVGCKYKERYYLVQAFEPDMYEVGDIDNRQRANSTYCLDNVKYITISKWCYSWLKEKYNVSAKYIRNGISIKKFKFIERDFRGKITILIEGDPDSFYKNIDESFEITNMLDKEKYEIIFLSNAGQPKLWYKFSKFYYKVPYDEIATIYGKADILIKSSFLESFSYPPLEMMATGGLVVAVQNDGNREFMIDGYNCMIYKKGDIAEAKDKIEILVNDQNLRLELTKNALNTVNDYEWISIEEKILQTYGG